jgi:hypothetical protein
VERKSDLFIKSQHPEKIEEGEESYHSFPKEHLRELRYVKGPFQGQKKQWFMGRKTTWWVGSSSSRTWHASPFSFSGLIITINFVGLVPASLLLLLLPF